MTITLEFEEAKELLQRAVQEKGEGYIYPRTEEQSCSYFWPQDGTPACLIGHLLAYKGVTADQVLEAGYNESSVSALVSSGFLQLPGDSSYKTVDLLVEAQNIQDGGDTWGFAVASALDAVEEQS